MEKFIPIGNIGVKSLDAAGEYPREKCGITAWVSRSGTSVSPTIYEMQIAINHRGEDNSGFAVLREDGSFQVDSRPGRVTAGFPNSDALPQGSAEIGHNRYATSEDPRYAQPVVAIIDGKPVLALAHNGNIPDIYRQRLRKKIPPKYHDKLTFDSAELVYAIATAQGNTWPEKIKNGLTDIPMAYALTMLTNTGEVYGMVGPSGHWPLWLGENANGIGLASETRAFPSGTKVTAINPGELVHITSKDAKITQLLPGVRRSRCSLHEDYGAKGDSLHENGESYKNMRIRLGEAIAYAQENPIRGDDVVYIGVPTSGLFIAEGYARALGEEITEVIQISDKHMQNGTNGRQRSFIAATIEEMQQIAAGKFNLNVKLAARLAGKRIVLIDDSVIRGTTIKGLIERFRTTLNVASIHVISGLPQVEQECDYGYNILREQGLIARRWNGTNDEILTEEQIATALGADSIHFASVRTLKEVFGEDICTECLHGGEIIQHQQPVRRQLTRMTELVS